MPSPASPRTPASPPSPALPPVASPPSPTAPGPQLDIVYDESNVDPIAREGRQRVPELLPWSGDVANLVVNGARLTYFIPSSGVVQVGPQLPSTPSPGSTPSQSGPVAAINVQVQTRNVLQHSVPIDWQLAQANPQPSSVTIQLGTRLRLSTWATPDADWVDTKTEGLARGAFVVRDGAGRPVEDRPAIDPAWGLDDVSFTHTVRLGSADSDDVSWDDGFLPTLQPDKSADRDKKLTAWLRDAIQFFHANKIQVFAGYGIVTEKANPETTAGDAFVKWLRGKRKGGAVPADAFAAHAGLLLKFFTDRGLDIDGISYDLEVNGLGKDDADLMQALYWTVADHLGQSERYVAFSGVETIPAGYLLEQPWSLAAHKNVIVRPMSYHQDRLDVARKAIGDTKLHPAHVQLGVATRDDPKQLLPESVDQEVAKYGPFRAGLVTWHLLLEDLQNYGGTGIPRPNKQPPNYDRALNPQGPTRGTPGQPLQGPLGPTRIAAFAAAARTASGRKSP